MYCFIIYIKPPSSIPKCNYYWTSLHVLQRYYDAWTSRFMRFILAKHYYTISTLLHVLGGYIVHKSCELFTVSNSNMARSRAPKVRACLPPAIGDVTSNLTAYCFPPFSLPLVIFTTYSWLHWQFQIWRRREFTFSLLTVGNTEYFKYGAGGKFFPTHSWQEWDIFTPHSWQHWYFQTWRRRGGSHVTGEWRG